MIKTEHTATLSKMLISLYIGPYSMWQLSFASCL